MPSQFLSSSSTNFDVLQKILDVKCDKYAKELADEAIQKTLEELFQKQFQEVTLPAHSFKSRSANLMVTQLFDFARHLFPFHLYQSDNALVKVTVHRFQWLMKNVLRAVLMRSEKAEDQENSEDDLAEEFSASNISSNDLDEGQILDIVCFYTTV